MWKYDRLVDRLSNVRRRKYMVVAASLAFVMNFFPDAHSPVISLLYLALYIAVMIAPPFLLFRDFNHALNPSIVKDGVSRNYLLRLAKFTFMTVFFVLINITFMTFVETFNHIAFPGFTSADQNIGGSNLFANWALSIMASTEEIWRWSLIATIILFIRKISGKKRAQAYPDKSLLIALIGSSILFGLAHSLEFQHYMIVGTVELCLTGCLLAVLALLSGNLGAVMLAHALYDMIVFFVTKHQNLDFMKHWFLILALTALFAVVPILSYRQKRKQELELMC